MASDLPNYLGAAFERLCRDLLSERVAAGETPFGIDIRRLGRWWDRGEHEIDIVAGNDQEVLLVECKLSRARFGEGSGARFRARDPQQTDHPPFALP